jgi:cysteine desulfurase
VSAPVYLDYNATTPMDKSAGAAMRPYLETDFGNASSRHSYGRTARAAIDKAREQVAAAVGARPEEVIFTASGTESNNAIIKGVAAMSTRANVAVSGIEHPCVLCAARALQRDCRGYFPLAVDENGILDNADLEATLKQDCALASVMLANNETGVIQDIPKIAAKVRAAGAVFHTDCAQALGKIPLDFRALGADAMTISGHKSYGPKGAAALIVKTDVSWAPLLDGGGHENGRRSGTENVAAIAGFGAACEIAAAQTADDAKRFAELQAQLEDGLDKLGATIFARDVKRLPNTTYFGFENIDGETLVLMLDQSNFCCAAGAACATMKEEPSHVLLAMGVPPELARCAVRASVGRLTSADDIAAFVQTTGALIKRLRSLAAVAG